jgi:ankyrin repeat domain-containing protein 50
METPGDFIWLNGFAGSGKSILASTVIQRIVGHVQSSEKTGLGYFYPSYADNNKQTCRGVLSSLILQLSRQSSDGILNDLYGNYFTGVPPQFALERTFKSLAERFEHTYIVIDALDESPAGEARDAICRLMGLIRDVKTVHLFVTSRDYSDIRNVLKAKPEADLSIQNEANLADIRKYISEHLRDDRFSKWKGYHPEIEEALSRNSGGMYEASFLDKVRC